MPPETVLGYLRATPFRPFRIVMKDGTFYEAQHHEAIRVVGKYFLFFVQEAPGQPFDHFTSGSLSLIDRIEPIVETASA